MSKQLLGLLLLSLSGCSTGQESFSSEPGPGFGWRSMSENHQRIAAMSDATPVDVKPPVIAEPALGVETRVAASPWIDVARTPPQYLRIWIPPYQDAQGNLHEEQAIHTIIHQGQWLLPAGGSF